MVEFNTALEEFPQEVPQEPETIERHVRDIDVAENALRVAADLHQASHTDGKHRVSVRDVRDDRLSKDDERVAEAITRKAEREHAYERLSAEQATGVSGAYGGRGAAGDGAYGHAHGEAACNCGWRVTAAEAMHQMLGTQHAADKGKSSTFTYESGTGKTGVAYAKSESLETLTHTYSSPLEGSQIQYQ